MGRIDNQGVVARRGLAAWISISAAVSSFAIIAGCASSPKRAELLIDDVRGYHDGLRWQRFNQAVLRIAVLERDDFISEREELSDDLRISDYDIIRVHYLEKGMRAKVTIRYMWYLDSRGIVHQTTANELWQRRGKRWFVTDEHRVRGARMPGLAERPPRHDDAMENETDSARWSVRAEDDSR